jgi:hypothetical protein
MQLLLVGLVCFLTGALTMQLPFVHAQSEKAKDPVFKHGAVFRVRKFDEPEFTKDTKRIGVEVYQDEYNGNLIYLTETGSIAVVPGGK